MLFMEPVAIPRGMAFHLANKTKRKITYAEQFRPDRTVLLLYGKADIVKDAQIMSLNTISSFDFIPGAEIEVTSETFLNEVTNAD